MPKGGGAYMAIMGLLSDSDVYVEEIGSEERIEGAYGIQDIWEWTVQS